MRSVEWCCLQELFHFSRRHLRYAKIGVLLYLLALKDRRLARQLRFGFCALQLIDDILDGDRPVSGEPLETIDALVAALASGLWQESRLHVLMRAFWAQIAQHENAVELQAQVRRVIAAMCFDRRRVRDQLVLTEDALRAQHHETFGASLDIVLALVGSSMRVSREDVLLDAFAWSSTIRDLDDDLAKGLVNIPREVWGDGPAKAAWLDRQRKKFSADLRTSREAVAVKADAAGRRVLLMFLSSMDRYA